MNDTNKNLTFKGNPMKVVGTELKVGQVLPPFKLTGNDMADVANANFIGKPLIISVVPSLDTPTCSMQTIRFNKEASEFNKEVNILTVSEDLPFAQSRWCGAAGVDRITTASDYKYREFGSAFGAWIEGMALLTRAVFVADKSGKLVYVEYTKELSEEPDYASALKKVHELL